MATKKAEAVVEVPTVEIVDPTVMAERRRIVDLAVRASQRAGYCDTFNTLLAEIVPDLGLKDGNGYWQFFDSDGFSCSKNHYEDYRVNVGFNADSGYDSSGYDRDGINREGRNKNGYTVEVGWNRYGENEKGETRKGRAATEAETAAEAVLAGNPTTGEPFGPRVAYGSVARKRK